MSLRVSPSWTRICDRRRCPDRCSPGRVGSISVEQLLAAEDDADDQAGEHQQRQQDGDRAAPPARAAGALVVRLDGDVLAEGLVVDERRRRRPVGRVVVVVAVGVVARAGPLRGLGALGAGGARRPRRRGASSSTWAPMTSRPPVCSSQAWSVGIRSAPVAASSVFVVVVRAGTAHGAGKSARRGGPVEGRPRSSGWATVCASSPVASCAGRAGGPTRPAGGAGAARRGGSAAASSWAPVPSRRERSSPLCRALERVVGVVAGAVGPPARARRADRSRRRRRSSSPEARRDPAGRPVARPEASGRRARSQLQVGGLVAGRLVPRDAVAGDRRAAGSSPAAARSGAVRPARSAARAGRRRRSRSGPPAVEELLQDDHGGRLVDHRALLAAVDAAFAQVTGCGHGGEPFVDQDHRHIRNAVG